MGRESADIPIRDTPTKFYKFKFYEHEYEEFPSEFHELFTRFHEYEYKEAYEHEGKYEANGGQANKGQSSPHGPQMHLRISHKRLFLHIQAMQE